MLPPKREAKRQGRMPLCFVHGKVLGGGHPSFASPESGLSFSA